MDNQSNFTPLYKAWKSPNLMVPIGIVDSAVKLFEWLNRGLNGYNCA
jgi:hypothetical protein